MMSPRDKELIGVSIVVVGAYLVVCFLDFAFGVLITGYYGSISETLWRALQSKPFGFRDLAIIFFVILLIGIIIVLWRQWLRDQRSQADARDYSREELRRAIQSQYQKRFWGTFALFTAAVLLVIIAFILLKDSTIWYAYDPWFSILYLMKTLFPYVIVAVWIGGVIVILFRQWRNSAADIVGLVDSIEQMQEGVYGDTISVPKDLTQLQPVLQDMFNASCRDKVAAEEAEKRKRDLILYLAHDLKTPLTSVIGYLSLLTESGDLTESQKTEYTAIAKDKALRLESLTDQFFEISRFNLHEVHLEQSDFNLKLLLLQLGDEFYPLVEEQGKTIQITAEDDLIIRGDASRLARVFDNILKNAIAYSDAESVIELKAELAGDTAVVSVKNSGATIPKEQLDTVFEKFYRLDESRTSKTGGAGLGLAIAREIVIQHHGSITAQSEDGITVFTVTLPQR